MSTTFMPNFKEICQYTPIVQNLQKLLIPIFQLKILEVLDN